MTRIQLDFFKTEQDYEIEELKEEVERLRESSNKVRKGTYARINEINKLAEDLAQRLKYIECYICSKRPNDQT